MVIYPSDFDIKPGYFKHESHLHGTLHTYRVMCHVMALGSQLDKPHETLLAFCAAFVHDMARHHDGFCLMHGPRAAREKVPEFIPLFTKYELNAEDISAIKTAVSNHSQYVELKIKHPHYLVTALLKDADALDRVRMGEGNLKQKYLRLPATAGLIPFSSQLYCHSEHKNDFSMKAMLDIAEKLLGKNLID